MSAKTISISSAFLILALFSPATSHATKCFIAETVPEFLSIFPIVISGTIVARTPRADPSAESGSESRANFELKIKVDSVMKGELKAVELSATETHSISKFTSHHVYKIGQHAIFPVEKSSAKDAYRVLLPQDGCPDLPVR